MKCPKCNVDMKMGFAIAHERDRGARVIVYYPITYMKKLEIINCLKCPKCGHSDDMK